MSKSVTGLIIYMGQATTSVGFIGFGVRDIGAGITITESGSTDITRRDKFLLFLEQIKIQLLRKNLKALSDSATQYYRSQIFFWTGNKSNRRASLIQDPLLITSCDKPDEEVTRTQAETILLKPCPHI